MEQKSIFEQLGGTYSQQGDYMLPNLKLPDQPEYNIGVWDSAAGVISNSTDRFSTPIC